MSLWTRKKRQPPSMKQEAPPSKTQAVRRRFWRGVVHEDINYTNDPDYYKADEIKKNTALYLYLNSRIDEPEIKPSAQERAERIVASIWSFFTKILLILYYALFLVVWYVFYAGAQKEYQVWIVTNICIGLIGAVMFVYPLTSARQGLGDTFLKWMAYLWLSFVLYAISLIISELIGKGTINVP